MTLARRAIRMQTLGILTCRNFHDNVAAVGVQVLMPRHRRREYIDQFSEVRCQIRCGFPFQAVTGQAHAGVTLVSAGSDGDGLAIYRPAESVECERIRGWQ